VTSQPDIAEIFIEGDIHDNDLVAVSTYLGSFFNRECFHELCVEYIYSDLIKAGFDIKKVEGYFERRGGIAIIPIRYSQ
jgi:NADPH-dependent 7-cyano-7-deazaguanine reductase QueF